MSLVGQDLVPAAEIEPATPGLQIGGGEKSGRLEERRQLICLDGFDVINRELTWQPLHLSRLSTTKQT
jgi:hypothetical protein